MKPIDKFNRPIYKHVFNVLKRYGDTLIKLGWAESVRKNLLFYKKFDGELVFADMRGTQQVPIWQEPYPMIYTNSRDEAWKRRRVIRYATEELDGCEIPYRFSYEDTGEEGRLFAGEPDTLADGQCKTCRKEIDHAGLFCSTSCETIFKQIQEERAKKYEKKCRICGKPLEWGSDSIRHHLDYDDEEKKLDLCRSCHSSLHARRKEHPELAPTRPKKEKKPLIIPLPILNPLGFFECPKCHTMLNDQNSYENHWVNRHRPGRKKSSGKKTTE